MRDSKGRFVAKKRRNPDGAGYLAGGVFHPVRSWAGYDPSKLTNAKERKTEEHEATAKRRYRKPRLKAGSPRQRSEQARRLLSQRKEQRERREADARAAREHAARERAASTPRRSTPARGTSRVAGAGPATEAQRRFIADLLARKGHRIVRLDDAARYLHLTGAQWARLSKADASRYIDRLKS